MFYGVAMFQHVCKPLMNQYVKQKEAQESHRILRKLLDVFWGNHQTTLIKNITGWWFGTFFIVPYIGNFIIPTDELIFFSRSTTNQIRNEISCFFLSMFLRVSPERSRSGFWTRRRNRRFLHRVCFVMASSKMNKLEIYRYPLVI